MGSTNSTDLWDYANHFYSSDPIKDRCLDLQEIYGASVDVILWLCWLESNQIRLDRAVLDQAKNVVGGVNERLLSGLRDMRAELLAGSSFTRVQEQLIRKHILNAELAIEKVLLQRLQDMTSRLSKVAEGDEALSLFDYFSYLSMDGAGEEAAFFMAYIQRDTMNDIAELSV